MNSAKIYAAEAHLQKVLYQLVDLQTDTSKTTTEVQQAVNERMKEEVDSFAGIVKVNSILQSEAKYVSIATIGLSIFLGICSVAAMLTGNFIVAAIIGALTGLCAIEQGGLEIASGVVQMDSAQADGRIKKDAALSKYLGDNNNSINTKTKEVYQVLGTLTRLLNQLLATFGDSVIKPIK